MGCFLLLILFLGEVEDKGEWWRGKFKDNIFDVRNFVDTTMYTQHNNLKK
jgi:hypothetical protein